MMEDEDNAFDQIAPNAEQENREADNEGIIEADKFVYFNPNRIVEQRHYDIGIELQSSCSVPPEETTGIMLPDYEYLTLLRNLNLCTSHLYPRALGAGDIGDIAELKCRNLTSDVSRQCRGCAGVLISR